MDVGKYRALFIEEMREHLHELSRLLVALEKAPGRGGLVDEVFRMAHSIKGMAASMGYDPITALAHRMEDVVQAERRHSAPFGRGVIDLLLSSADAVSSQVEAIAEGSVLEGFHDLLRDLGCAAEEAQRRGAAQPPSETPEAGQPAMPSTLAAGRQVRVVLEDGCAAPSVRAFLIHRHLSGVGEIVASDPSLETIKKGGFLGHEIRFVLARVVDEPAVQQLLTCIPDVNRVTFEDVSQGDVTPSRSPVQASPRADAAAAWQRVASDPTDEPPASNEASTPVSARDASRPVAGSGGGAGETPSLLRQGGRGVGTVRVRTDTLDTLIDTVGELFIDRQRLRILLSDHMRPEVRAALDGLDARIRRIHNQVMSVRMVPLRSLTDRYPRLVRDLCHSLGKAVELEIIGDDIELDRAVLDHVDVPLIHVLRNAIDHGYESPAERVERGKRSAGRLQLVAARDRDSVRITIEDDGRGMDPRSLRRAAVTRGLLTQEQADKLSERESLFLVCIPGFSTKAEVTDVSGRGVGMDAVRAAVEGVGGSVDIDSALGRGTRFTLRLPLSVSIMPALLVAAGGRTFAVPVARVMAVREGATEPFEAADGSLSMSYDGTLVPVRRLSKLLRLQAAKEDDTVLVIEDGRDTYALSVERVVGYHEAVVKPLGAPLDWLEWFSGATILGDGQPVLILDLPRALRSKAAA